jgi:hypothetical protein
VRSHAGCVGSNLGQGSADITEGVFYLRARFLVGKGLQGNFSDAHCDCMCVFSGCCWRNGKNGSRLFERGRGGGRANVMPGPTIAWRGSHDPHGHTLAYPSPHLRHRLSDDTVPELALCLSGLELAHDTRRLVYPLTVQRHPISTRYQVHFTSNLSPTMLARPSG